MLYYAVAIAVIFLTVFLVLPVRYKTLVALVLMTNGFDMTPDLIQGRITWDYGAILLLITGAQLLFVRNREAGRDKYGMFVQLLIVFWLWMFIPLLWSLFVYTYPPGGTLKYSRHMLVGYLSFFIFLRLYQVDPTAFRKVMQGLYAITFVLMTICVLQFAVRKQILFGLFRDYASVTRYLPIMLPFCLLNLWEILSKALTGEKLKIHEVIYSGLATAVLIMTFTRGLYLAALGVVLVGVGYLMVQRRLNSRGAFATVMVFMTAIAVAGALGGLDLAASRLKSGAEILTAAPVEKFGYDADTFSGRLRLARERIEMSAERNPLMGYGFLNEDDVPQRLRNSLRYGSIIYSPDMVRAYRYGHPYVLALHSADISWGDLVLNTGFVGLFLFLSLLIALFANSFLVRAPHRTELVHWRLACLMQTLMTLVITFESNSIVVNVQVFSFMLAGYAYCSAVRPQPTVRIASNRGLVTGIRDINENHDNHPLLQPR